MLGTLLPRLLLLGLLAAATNVGAGEKPDYPAAPAEQRVDQIHGTPVPDPFRWLEAGDDPRVRTWTEQQNALTRRMLDQFTPERKALTEQLEKLYGIGFTGRPARFGDRYLYLQRDGLQNHAVVMARDGGLGGDSRVVLNPNEFSEDGTVALDWWQASRDGALILYGKSSSGDEWSTMYLRDVRTATDTSLMIPRTRACSVAWDEYGKGFYYTRYPEPGKVPTGDENYYRRVYYHKFGTDWHIDREVYGKDRPKEEWTGVYNSEDDRYVFLSASLDWARNDLYVRKYGGGEEFQKVAVDLPGRFNGDAIGDKLLLLTDFEAPRYRVLTADPQNPGHESWKELIPQQKGVILGLTVANGRIVLNVLEDAFSRLLVFEADGRPAGEIKLPTVGTVGDVSAAPDKPELFFEFESFVHPPQAYQVDMATLETKPFAPRESPVNPDDYVTEQVWFNSKDGTRVPMFIVSRKGMQKNGQNPTMLFGYGGFNNKELPRFGRALSALPFIDRGGILAVANLRGGGEFGRDWHEAGRGPKKQNVFDDMIAAAEKLIADRYTSKEKLAIRGGSNGGLLVGAMVTQRPDLFRAVHCAVPLLDMIRYTQFSIARLWIPEYGSADDAAQFKTLLAYSPYHNVKPDTCYPAVLLTTAESDSRVDPMHARKMAALLQSRTSCDNPILLWVETKAGHGAGKPTSKRIVSDVDYLIFFFWQLGMIPGAA